SVGSYAKMSQIDVNQVWKVYPRGNVIGVKDLTFTCQDKEFLSILGPSGSGKSSTLRMLAGLEEISRGEISFDGKVVNSLEPAERNIALAFESYALYQRLTVYENIAFPLRARKMSNAEVNQKVNWIAELLDVTDVLSKYPSSLAGGHQQRVSLARAFVRKPNVTLLDEPISHMDQRVRAALRARIRRLHDELGLTTIYVTHDQAEAISLCDRLAIINKAELQQIGTVEEIYSQPSTRFVAYFVGEPSMNFVEGRVEAPQRISIPTPEGRMDLTVSGDIDPKHAKSEIIVGFRPQQVKVAHLQPENASIPGSVKITEFQGETTVLTVTLGDVKKSEIKVVVSASETFNAGDTIWLRLAPDIIHLFDEDTPVLQRVARKE
ncbi:MAG: ABC transporter ATP-binding protein, partial [Desulfobacteraceae bacterium]|nr:ABC transporter ATP-binding protein [Desulfobacteraceae bacterium]